MIAYFFESTTTPRELATTATWLTSTAITARLCVRFFLTTDRDCGLVLFFQFLSFDMVVLCVLLVFLPLRKGFFFNVVVVVVVVLCLSLVGFFSLKKRRFLMAWFRVIRFFLLRLPPQKQKTKKKGEEFFTREDIPTPYSYS